MTDIAAVIFIHFLFCLTLCASNVDENFQINFCDVRPNCDGDSELFEKLIEYVPADSLQGNHSDNDIFMHYPVKRTKRSGEMEVQEQLGRAGLRPRLPSSS